MLPLANDEGNSAEEVFAAGMTDALSAQLGATGTVRVISRASVIHVMGSGKTVPEIGRALGADAILSGSVGRSSDRIKTEPPSHRRCDRQAALVRRLRTERP